MLFLDQVHGTLLPQRIATQHPEPETDDPGCTAAFARHGYLIMARTRNNSLYRLKA
ncbi:MAG: hypothetical protein AAGB18_05810 [Pseudomonadota bacterium]